MGIKHLKTITEILICAEEPMTLWNIKAKYETKNKPQINPVIIKETLKHLLDEKQIKIVKMCIHCRDRTGYVWVG